jgi:two-component system phosphate regulon sensor histidine kinase PhoR
MKTAIRARLYILAILAAAACSAVSSCASALSARSQAKLWIGRLTVAAASLYDEGKSAKWLSGAAGGARVTIIGPDGTVLDDSEAESGSMENHSSRGEVKNAKAGAAVFEIRKSSTLSRNFLYSSIKLEDGKILRLANEYPGLLDSALSQFPVIALALSAALALSFTLGRKFASDVSKPLEQVVRALSSRQFDKLDGIKCEWDEIDKLLQSMKLLLSGIAESNQVLANEREKINRILSDMPEGLVLLDGKRRMLLCNNSAKRLFGCAKDVRNDNVWALIRDQKANNAIDEALSNGKASSLVIGSPAGLTLRISVSPVEAGQLVEGETCAAVMIVDMTAERKLAEQKQDFFANASHELKTPITSIMGFSEMLGSGILQREDQRSDLVKRIEKEARRMSALIDDILQISNLESRTGPMDRDIFDFASVIRESGAAILPMAGGDPVWATIDLEHVQVEANQRQLRDLCDNLIENAVKYNVPGGSVVISLKAEGDCAIFSVRDTGIGIPKESQPRVFERFFRANPGKSKRISGTGLGLSIVKHIVNLYGGEIKLESKEGEGTLVEVRLPIVSGGLASGKEK